jgi:hypothetical protein
LERCSRIDQVCSLRSASLTDLEILAQRCIVVLKLTAHLERVALVLI